MMKKPVTYSLIVLIVISIFLVYNKYSQKENPFNKKETLVELVYLQSKLKKNLNYKKYPLNSNIEHVFNLNENTLSSIESILNKYKLTTLELNSSCIIFFSEKTGNFFNDACYGYRIYKHPIVKSDSYQIHQTINDSIEIVVYRTGINDF